MLKLLTLGDKLLIILLVGATIGSYLGIGLASEGETVLIEVDGKVAYKLDLQESCTTIVRGARGELKVEIKEGMVAVTRADCPNRICVRTGWRGRSGEVIICVPNKTLVRITGSTEAGVKAVTG